jgi:hypothetical protein
VNFSLLATTLVEANKTTMPSGSVLICIRPYLDMRASPSTLSGFRRTFARLWGLPVEGVNFLSADIP